MMERSCHLKQSPEMLKLPFPVGFAGQPSVAKIRPELISVEERFLSAHGLRDSNP